MNEMAIVNAPNGSTVNLRKEAYDKAPLVDRVPVGKTVEILEEQGDWCEVMYNGKHGYMMRQYLKPTTETGTVPVPRDWLENIYAKNYQ